MNNECWRGRETPEGIYISFFIIVNNVCQRRRATPEKNYINIQKELNNKCVLEEEGDTREDLHRCLIRVEYIICAGGGKRQKRFTANVKNAPPSYSFAPLI